MLFHELRGIPTDWKILNLFETISIKFWWCFSSNFHSLSWIERTKSVFSVSSFSVSCLAKCRQKFSLLSYDELIKKINQTCKLICIIVWKFELWRPSESESRCWSRINRNYTICRVSWHRFEKRFRFDLDSRSCPSSYITAKMAIVQQMLWGWDRSLLFQFWNTWKPMGSSMRWTLSSNLHLGERKESRSCRNFGKSFKQDRFLRNLSLMQPLELHQHRALR